MIVVDANIVLPLLREDALTAPCRDLRARESVWIVPPLLRTELANALLKDVKAGFLNIKLALLAASALEELMAQVRVVDPSLSEVLASAHRSGLTAYDATYVVLARSLGVPLVTEDKQILRACPDVARSLEQFLSPPEPPRAIREGSPPYGPAAPEKSGAREPPQRAHLLPNKPETPTDEYRLHRHPARRVRTAPCRTSRAGSDRQQPVR